MTRRRHYTQEQLNELALQSQHPKQAAAARQYLDAHWNVYRTETREGCTVLMFQRGEMFGVMLPNGRFIRPLVGKKTVSYDWRDVRAAATL